MTKTIEIGAIGSKRINMSSFFGEFDFNARKYQDLVHAQEDAMARNTSVTLGDHFEEFIAGQIDSGRYGSTSEVIRAGLRLLETTESRLEALRNALVTGERSGEAAYSYESMIAELDSECR